MDPIHLPDEPGWMAKIKKQMQADTDRCGVE